MVNRCKAKFMVLATLILLLVCVTPIAVYAQENGAEDSVTRISPTSWEVVQDYGSYANPEYAYDNEFDDVTSKAVIKSPGDAGSETEIYESLAYTFSNVPAKATLFYTLAAEMGAGDCWNGSLEISYWNWSKSSWDQVGIWDDQDLATRRLGTGPDYINSDGVFKVRFLAKSGETYEYRDPTTIELYDTYVSSEESASVVPIAPEGESSPSPVVAVLSILIPALGAVAVVGASIKMKVHRDYKRLSQIIVNSMTNKVSAIVGVVATLGFGWFHLMGSGRDISRMTAPDIVAAVFMIPLVGLVIGLFAYNIQKGGILKSRQAGAGITGIIGAIVAIFVSLIACCGPIVIALLGAGLAVALAQYSTMLTSLSILILVFAIVLMTTTIKKHEDGCGVCCTSQDAVE